MKLALGRRSLEVAAGAPLVMGVVDARPGSSSDRGGPRDPGERADRALALVEQGAELVDVGGGSGRSERDAISEAEEAERVVPLVRRLAGAGVDVSVDTGRVGPAAAALEAGAAMVNDVSGLADPALARLCADAGAALVITPAGAPAETRPSPAGGDVVADVLALLADRAALALEAGVADDALVLDPGLGLDRTPAQSIELLARLPELYRLGWALLLDVSRPDFAGAVTGRSPAEGGAGTLAALEPALAAPAAIVRVQDVAAAVDYIAVRGALLGLSAAADGPLPEGLRREI